MNEKKRKLMQRRLSLAEALYEYGKGNDKQALQLFGDDFDANDCKAIGASEEQLDVFNEVWYTLLMVVFQEKGYMTVGREEAAIAAKKENYLENSFFK